MQPQEPTHLPPSGSPSKSPDAQKAQALARKLGRAAVVRKRFPSVVSLEQALRYATPYGMAWVRGDRWWVTSGLAPIEIPKTEWVDAYRYAHTALVTRDPDDQAPFLVGGMSFDGSRGAGDWAGWPDRRLVLPGVVWAHDGEQTFRIEHHVVQPSGATLVPEWHAVAQPEPVDAGLEFAPVEDKAWWCDQVDQATDAFASEALRKVVLSRRECAQVPSEMRFDWQATVRSLSKAHPSQFTFALHAGPAGVFVGSTPELLVGAYRDGVRADALAGTAAQADASALLQRDKDRREHEWVCQTISDELRSFASSVERDGPKVRHLNGLSHLLTEFTARDVDAPDFLRLVRTMHPTPAVGGWPRLDALAWIKEHEPVSRGWYAAPIGWLSADGKGEFAVALRSALHRDGVVTTFAGAGLVAGSDPESEWQETKVKLKTIQNHLRLARADG